MAKYGFLLIRKLICMDIENIQHHFPIFRAKEQTTSPFVYFDNANTTHKPQQVIDAITHFYSTSYANIGRGSYTKAHLATSNYEAVRHQVADFIKAKHAKEIVFTSGTTDGINKLAHGFFKAFTQPGDQILISSQGHHSNLLVWEQWANTYQLIVKEIPCNLGGQIDLEALAHLCQNRTALIAIEAGTNAFGTIQPVSEVVKLAQASGAKVLVDAAQWVTYAPTEVDFWDCDFLVFSAHKIFGPTGLGVLYGKSEWLDEMPPMTLGGGGVLRTVPETIFKESPYKHEAGTPHIAGVMGLGAALDFIKDIGFEQITAHANSLLAYALKELRDMEGVEIYQHLHSPALPIVSFGLPGIHPHDVVAYLNESQICLRAGHHCAQPALAKEGLKATLRASFTLYNTKAEIDELTKHLKAAQKFFS